MRCQRRAEQACGGVLKVHAWHAGAMGGKVWAHGMLWMLGAHLGKGAPLPDLWSAGTAASPYAEVLRVREEAAILFPDPDLDLI